MKIYSFSPFGYEGSLVSVEVDIRRGIPAIDIVGLADGAVRESRERMKSAIRNSGFDFPQERVLISLSPADLKKEGAGFDLSVALGVLCASGQKGFDLEKLELPSVLVLGELELYGALRPVRAVHAAASSAKAAGIRHCLVPKANANEAREVFGMKVFGASNLREAFEALFSEKLFSKAAETAGLDSIPKGSERIDDVLFPPVYEGCGFEDIRGQRDLVRACTIAAAGGHNLLAFGPPGCGKSLILQRFSSLLPLLTAEEAQSVTRVHSIAGLMPPGQGLVRIPPFRQPHMSASLEGLCGGGNCCRPGEVSLAHNGVLFLDEAAEFKASALQMLRVPLESQKISLSRAGRTAVYPANFQLLMASNPC
ncbi:MAG: YifB family Mg chelatase-like AAA ATPase, partial [Treponema sp.]|nr:YifB family Mg chelatase-like AAA ATPase [Treponema sp.]